MKKLNPVCAYYVAALAAVVCGVGLPVYSVGGLVVFCLVVGGAYGVTRRVFCAREAEAFVVKFAKTGVGEADEILKKGRDFLTKLNGLNASIEDETLKKQVNALIKTGRDIFDFVEKNPTQTRQLGDFIEYYLPTSLKLVGDYVELSAKADGNASGGMADALARITGVMETVTAAFYKQLDNIYAAKTMDIAAEISVLETTLKREGLK